MAMDMAKPRIFLPRASSTRQYARPCLPFVEIASAVSGKTAMVLEMAWKTPTLPAVSAAPKAPLMVTRDIAKVAMVCPPFATRKQIPTFSPSFGTKDPPRRLREKALATCLEITRRPVAVAPSAPLIGRVASAIADTLIQFLVVKAASPISERTRPMVAVLVALVATGSRNRRATASPLPQ